MYSNIIGIHSKLVAYILDDCITLYGGLTKNEFNEINRWIKPFENRINLLDMDIELIGNDFNEINSIFPHKISKEDLFDEKNNIKQHFLNKIEIIQQYSLLKTQIEEIKHEYNPNLKKIQEKDINISFTKPFINKNYSVIYNENDLYSFIIENPTDLEQSILDKKLLGFKELCFFNLDEKYKSYSSIIYSFFHLKFYNNQNEIGMQLKIIKSLLEKTKSENNLYEEKCLIEKYIKTTYKITNNSVEKIKSSHLQKEIEKEIKPIDKTFRNRLSKYLLEMGIKKKRMTDGIYYYGLRPSNNILSIL